MSTSRRLPSISLIVAILALLTGGIALVVAVQPEEHAPAAAPTLTPTPVPNGAMWSVGTGGDGVNPYIEWVALYPTSSLWNILGAPSLRFTDHAPNTPGDNRSFEIGFYKYGPTWHTQNHIIELWIGTHDEGGTLSVIGNDGGGGQIEARNPTDTDHIALDYRDPDHPVINTNTQPLALKGKGGIVSESKHIFKRGIVITSDGGFSGQVIDGAWQDGALVIASQAITAESLVLITPISEPRGRWWVDGLIPGESFTLHSTASDETMDFNWMVIGREN
jgi:hypothetical protein